jgi:polar amino acid transport system ATP-binding protein
MNAADAYVSLHDVAKRFDETIVLDDISLSIKLGEIVCVMGPSGSGKTTLLRSVNALSPVDKGRITVGDHVVTDANVDLRSLRLTIGMVFQRFGLFPHKSALENIVMGQVDILARSRAEATDKARGLLDRLGIDEFRDRYPGQLSSGQQQRVALARTLAMDTKALLLDEITASLDPRMVERIGQLIKERAAAGTAILASSHDLQFVASFADNVAYLDGGHMRQVGAPSEMLAFVKAEEARHEAEDAERGD